MRSFYKLFLKISLFAIFFIQCNIFSKEGLISPSFIRNNLTKDAVWSLMHGAEAEYLGSAMLYYSLAYSHKARLCVCLGSGDGFVPRVMRQAQRDLCLLPSKTILIDGNKGAWGRPQWISPRSFFRTAYPEIEIYLDLTYNVARKEAKEWKINYLHIDADRTTKGVLQDFSDYLPLMAENGVITLHDTGRGRPCEEAAKIIQEMGHPVVTFEELGTGVSIIQLQPAHQKKGQYDKSYRPS